jgi:hypothetical protein
MINDLEQNILECWNVTTDLDYILDQVEDDDNISNLVLGIKNLYEAKFEKLWQKFKETIRA